MTGMTRSEKAGVESRVSCSSSGRLGHLATVAVPTKRQSCKSVNCGAKVIMMMIMIMMMIIII